MGRAGDAKGLFAGEQRRTSVSCGFTMYDSTHSPARSGNPRSFRSYAPTVPLTVAESQAPLLYGTVGQIPRYPCSASRSPRRLHPAHGSPANETVGRENRLLNLIAYKLKIATLPMLTEAAFHESLHLLRIPAELLMPSGRDISSALALYADLDLQSIKCPCGN